MEIIMEMMGFQSFRLKNKKEKRTLYSFLLGYNALARLVL